MTDTSNYRVVAHYNGEDEYDLVHMDDNKKCQQVLLTTVNFSVANLTELVHTHSLACRHH